MVVQIAIIQGDTHHLALFFTTQIGHQVAHGQALVTQCFQHTQLLPEAIGRHVQASERHTFGGGISDLVVGQDRNSLAIGCSSGFNHGSQEHDAELFGAHAEFGLQRDGFANEITQACQMQAFFFL